MGGSRTRKQVTDHLWKVKRKNLRRGIQGRQYLPAFKRETTATGSVAACTVVTMTRKREYNYGSSKKYITNTT